MRTVGVWILVGVMIVAVGMLIKASIVLWKQPGLEDKALVVAGALAVVGGLLVVFG